MIQPSSHWDIAGLLTTSTKQFLTLPMISLLLAQYAMRSLREDLHIRNWTMMVWDFGLLEVNFLRLKSCALDKLLGTAGVVHLHHLKQFWAPLDEREVRFKFCRLAIATVLPAQLFIDNYNNDFIQMLYVDNNNTNFKEDPTSRIPLLLWSFIDALLLILDLISTVIS